VSASRAATANVLGALALAIADQLAPTGPPAGSADSAAAALSALDEFLDEPSVTVLCDVLGLSHSGTVRLLERLSAADLVTRGPGPDGRTRSVHLTAAGRRAARNAADKRAAYLDGMLEGLTPNERQTLHGLLAKLMSQAVDMKAGGAWICRRCNLRACGRPQGNCPAAIAAAHKYGPPVE
jgi:DNA-binding MarR family transcriptional regulator